MLKKMFPPAKSILSKIRSIGFHSLIHRGWDNRKRIQNITFIWLISQKGDEWINYTLLGSIISAIMVFGIPLKVFSSFKIIVCYYIRIFIRPGNVQPNHSSWISLDATVNKKPVELEFIISTDVTNVIWSPCSINSVLTFWQFSSFNSLQI